MNGSTSLPRFGVAEVTIIPTGHIRRPVIPVGHIVAAAATSVNWAAGRDVGVCRCGME